MLIKKSIKKTFYTTEFNFKFQTKQIIEFEILNMTSVPNHKISVFFIA